MDKILDFCNLSKEYISKDGIITALNKVSFSIYKGEFVAFTGSSGAGKSTLLNMVGCLDKPDKGKLYYRNKNLFSYSERQAAFYRNRIIGFVFQSFNLDPKLTAVENVALPLIYSSASKKERRIRSMEALEKVGLCDRASHKPSELSGGQKQRVAIARAIVNRPEIILADEPTGNLDPSSAKAVMELLCRINREGKTVLMVTHNPSQLKYCTRAISLQDGVIVSDTLF